MGADLEGRIRRNEVSRRKLLDHQFLKLIPFRKKFRGDFHLGQVQKAAPENFDLIVDHAFTVFGDIFQGAPDSGEMGIDAPFILMGRFQGVTVGAMVHGIHGGITGRPVVPPQFIVPVRDLALVIVRLGDDLGLHGKRQVIGPFDVKVVFVIGVVRRRTRLDQHGVQKAVQVQDHHGVPIRKDLDGGAGFGLALGNEIAVDIEAVGILPRVHHPAVGILHHVHQQDHIFQDPADVLAVLVGQLFDQPDGRVDTWILIAVDTAVDKDRDLEITEFVDHLLGGLGIRKHGMPNGLVAS